MKIRALANVYGNEAGIKRVSTWHVQKFAAASNALGFETYRQGNADWVKRAEIIAN